MSEAFVFSNTFRIKEGKLDEYRRFVVEKVVPAVEGGEPNMMQFGIFLDEDTMEATSLQVHRTVENFAFHMNLISQMMEEGRDLIDFSEMSARIYGTPTEQILQQMKQMAGSGVEVSISGAISSFDRFA